MPFPRSPCNVSRENTRRTTVPSCKKRYLPTSSFVLVTLDPPAAAPRRSTYRVKVMSTTLYRRGSEGSGNSGSGGGGGTQTQSGVGSSVVGAGGEGWTGHQTDYAAMRHITCSATKACARNNPTVPGVSDPCFQAVGAFSEALEISICGNYNFDKNASFDPSHDSSYTWEGDASEVNPACQVIAAASLELVEEVLQDLGMDCSAIPADGGEEGEGGCVQLSFHFFFNHVSV